MRYPLVFIDGDQGTTGLQIHERLRDRDDLRLLTLPAGQRKDARARAEAINACDIAILCLPDAAAREAVASIANPAVRVIDASSAHRTQAGWTYGFPEMAAGRAQRIAGALRVSNPGCYPTGAIGLLRPWWRAACCRPLTRSPSMPCRATPAAAAPRSIPTRDRTPTGPAVRVYGGTARTSTRPRSSSTRAGAAPRVRPGLRRLPPGHRADGGAGTGPAGLRHGRRQAACLPADHYAGARHVEVMAPAEAAAATTRLDPQALNGTNDLRPPCSPTASMGRYCWRRCSTTLGKGASGAAVQNLDLMLAGVAADARRAA